MCCESRNDQDCAKIWITCVPITFGVLLSFLIIVCLILLPNEAKITITDAHLTQFNFTNNTTLNYNLSFDITIRNPNKRLGSRYTRVRVIGKYCKQQFAVTTLPNTTVPFYQGHKNTTFLRDVSLQGQQVVKFGEKEFSQYDKETAGGVYTIDAVLSLRVEMRLGTSEFRNYGPDDIHCKLKLPMTTTLDQTSATSFTPTKCENVGIVRGSLDSGN